MILFTHGAMRQLFAERADLNGPSVTWDAATSTAEVSLLEWGDYGFQEGMYIDVVESPSNNGRWLITERNGVFITIEGPEGTSVVSAADTPVIVGVHRDLDGHPRWPLHKVRSGGFTGGFEPVGYDSFQEVVTFYALRISVDGEGVGSPAYDIYVSQRTDDASKQYLDVEDVPNASGTWDLKLKPLAVSDFGLSVPSDPLNDDQLKRLLKYVAIYVRRHSDGSIQWLDLYKAIVGT